MALVREEWDRIVELAIAWGRDGREPGLSYVRRATSLETTRGFLSQRRGELAG